MRQTLFFLCLLFASLQAKETIILSDEVNFDGEIITLSGNLCVEHAMGKVTAKSATLKKDLEKSTSMDFPWIGFKDEVCLTLARGGTLRCQSIFIDHTKLTGTLVGDVCYADGLCEISSESARIDYQEWEGSFIATQVTLFEQVRLVRVEEDKQPAMQYALADVAYYFPQDQRTILEGTENRVLFYDKQRDIQISARKVLAQKDPITKKERIQGVGDVHVVFGPDELAKMNLFQKSRKADF